MALGMVNERQQQGAHAILWHPENIASGSYFYQLQVDGKSFGSKKAIIINCMYYFLLG